MEVSAFLTWNKLYVLFKETAVFLDVFSQHSQRGTPEIDGMNIDSHAGGDFCNAAGRSGAQQLIVFGHKRFAALDRKSVV